MTSMQWVYEPTEVAEINARAAAMTFADGRLRGRIAPRAEMTDLEKLALVLRQAELTWGDREQPGVEPPFVRVRMSQIYWAVFWAQATVGVLGALLVALNHR